MVAATEEVPAWVVPDPWEEERTCLEVPGDLEEDRRRGLEEDLVPWRCPLVEDLDCLLGSRLDWVEDLTLDRPLEVIVEEEPDVELAEV